MDGGPRITQLSELKRKLELVDCPLIDEIDEEWVSSLLFQPSEARTKLLIWLVTAFDPEFENILQNQAYTATTKVESRVQKLLFICHTMGLCSASDLEIIKGSASERDQMTFWQNLLDSVILEHALFAANRNKLPPSKSSSDIYNDACQLIDTLARQGLAPCLYEKSVKVYPPDIEKQLGLDKKDKRINSAPSQKELRSSFDELEKRLAVHRKELADLKKEHSSEEMTDSVIDSLSKKVDIACKINAQQLMSFCMTYEHEFQPWCINKARPRVSGLGEVTDAVYELITDHDQLHSNIRKLQNCYASMSRKIPQDFQQIVKLCGSTLSKDRLEQLRSSVEILEETQQRLQSS